LRRQHVLAADDFRDRASTVALRFSMAHDISAPEEFSPPSSGRNEADARRKGSTIDERAIEQAGR
jgi:hypothetical protein